MEQSKCMFADDIANRLSVIISHYDLRQAKAEPDTECEKHLCSNSRGGQVDAKELTHHQCKLSTAIRYTDHGKDLIH
jgi:hypothetical protein